MVLLLLAQRTSYLIAWVENEDDIPLKLLKYLKENYSVKTGYSKTIGRKCFANDSQNEYVSYEELYGNLALRHCCYGFIDGFHHLAELFAHHTEVALHVLYKHCTVHQL